MHDILLSEATTAEQDGNPHRAATLFFSSGAYLMAIDDFESTVSFRKGLAYWVRTVSNEVRAGRESTALHVADLFEDVAPILTEEGNERVVRGLGYEWLGDVRYMTGEDEAATEYREAIEEFEHLDFETQLHWGARPEYDTAFLSLRRYLDDQGIEYFDDHDIDFAGRAKWKLDVLSSSMGQE